MKIMPCPLNGPRNIQEFICAGPVEPHPDPNRCSDHEWTEYVWMEENLAGVVREWWCHVATSYWFIAERNTVTDEILATYPADRVFSERVAFKPLAPPPEAAPAPAELKPEPPKEATPPPEAPPPPAEPAQDTPPAPEPQPEPAEVAPEAPEAPPEPADAVAEDEPAADEAPAEAASADDTPAEDVAADDASEDEAPEEEATTAEEPASASKDQAT